MRRNRDPFRNDSQMSALAVLVRTKAEKAESDIDSALTDELISDEVEIHLMNAKTKLLEIIHLVEGP